MKTKKKQNVCIEISLWFLDRWCREASGRGLRSPSAAQQIVAAAEYRLLRGYTRFSTAAELKRYSACF
ncbi:hypothetical protein HC931_28075 [Candidatus Gracilibacteria bacterium]|nr:hypothetical protein [Candidatus Gracilibacteria bacterium]NJP22393.1 hypothetical protein [Hydrococcus sp. CRU_1_1]